MTSLIHRIEDWKAVASANHRDETIGLVPTMGALHQGHGALFDEARRSCSVVVASIFVNSLQFDKKSDYDLYPKVLDDDAAFCAARGVNYIFAPSDGEMYPHAQRAFVDVERLSEQLCGQNRPGHFRGVATVVMKLFQILQPNAAFFGEKDYQQLAIVRRMVQDLNIPVQMVGVPTVWDDDGLAMSSRNRRLSRAERSIAPCLFVALTAARNAIAAGERNAAVVRHEAIQFLQTVDGIRMEYFDLIDPDTIQPIQVIAAPVRAAAAIWIGDVRLIDDVLCEPPVFTT